ncbi:hypothetical protein GGR57DRAFT_119841 [Xylariaceae sp. FL1272]|nr:hypothetical protein GGR57DRAFT_119841 [Xylariaceae sp. FL1272]
MLGDVEVDVVTAMVQFMYHFDYQAPGRISESLFHAKVYSIAKRYLIPELKEHSKNKFGTAMKKFWQIRQPEDPDTSDLIQHCKKFTRALSTGIVAHATLLPSLARTTTTTGRFWRRA